MVMTKYNLCLHECVSLYINTVKGILNCIMTAKSSSIAGTAIGVRNVKSVHILSSRP